MSEWSGFQQDNPGEGITACEVPGLLTSLVEKSLVNFDDAAGRYRLLETFRAYGHAQLADAREANDIRASHADYYIALAEYAEPNLTGPAQQKWLAQLETEHDNLRAALEWTTTAGGSSEAGLRLGGAIWRFWMIHCYLTEGRRWLTELLAAGIPGARSEARAKVLNGSGVLAYQQGEYSACRPLFEESLAIQRELGNQLGIAIVLNNLGLVVRAQGDYAYAEGLFSETLTITRDLGHQRGITCALTNLGYIAYDQSDYAAAQTFLEESLALERELGDMMGMADALTLLGNTAQRRGDHSAAQALHGECLALGRELGNRFLIGDSLHNLGWAAYHQGNYLEARSLHAENLRTKRDLAARKGIAESLEGLASIAAVLDGPLPAARIWGAAERLRQEIDSLIPPSERPAYEVRVSDARAALADDSAFERAWQEGWQMTLDQAIRLALEDSEGA